MDALSSSLTTMTTRVSDAMRSTSSQGTAVTASSAIGDVGESELQKIAAKRSNRFVETFGRQCVDATRANVRDAEERLRETALNAAISCEASATSDLPTLERATKAMSSSAKLALEEYERRRSLLPSLRYSLLEDLSEKKLALEKKIEAANAPRELKRRQALKDMMSKPA